MAKKSLEEIERSIVEKVQEQQEEEIEKEEEETPVKKNLPRLTEQEKRQQVKRTEELKKVRVPQKKCPITREFWEENKRALEGEVEGEAFRAPSRYFSTGSFGWMHNTKQDVIVGGEVCRAQVQITVTIIGSKDV